MATLTTLTDRSELVRLGGGLEKWERAERELYAFPHVINWLDETLPSLNPDLSGGIQSPLEQVDDLFHDFVCGEDFDLYEKAHFMRPSASAVWELKTPDTRFFGWFYQRGVFIIANAYSAFDCKQYDLYEGFRVDVERRRSALDLDEPKCVFGGYRDVL